MAFPMVHFLTLTLTLTLTLNLNLNLNPNPNQGLSNVMLRFVTPTSLIRVAVEVPADVVANNETLPLDLIFHVPMPIVGGALLTEASQAAQPLLHPREASRWPTRASGRHLHPCRLRADPRRAQRAAVRGHRHALPIQRLLRRAGDPHRPAGPN